MIRSEIKQKNEGGWSFRWDEESQPGFVLLEVGVARFLDSSLIDVDVHPSYISIIIKSKVFNAMAGYNIVRLPLFLIDAEVAESCGS